MNIGLSRVSVCDGYSPDIPFSKEESFGRTGPCEEAIEAYSSFAVQDV